MPPENSDMKGIKSMVLQNKWKLEKKISSSKDQKLVKKNLGVLTVST